MVDKKSIVKGFGWSTVQIIIDRGLGIIVKLILARILVPEDFGLIGMAAVFLTFMQVFYEIGLGSALIQKKTKVTNLEFNTAFWSTLAWSLILYALLYFSSPPISDFYGQAELTPILRVMGIGILTLPVNLIQRIQMNRNLRFKELALVNNISNIVGAIAAIAGALYGLGVWSLVIQSTGPLLLRVPLYYFYGSWAPSFRFSLQIFKSIASFGLYTTGADFLIKVINQADYLLVGKMMGAFELGIYSFAFLITATLRNQILILIKKVMFPVYSKFQDDVEKLRYYYLLILQLNAYLTFPLFALILLFADEFVMILFPKWELSIPLIKIFTLGIIINVLTSPFGPFILGVGKPRVQLYVQLVRAVIYIILLVLGYHFFKLEGVAWAFAITSAIISIYVLVWMSRNYKITILNSFARLKLPFAGLLVMLMVGFSLDLLGTNTIVEFCLVLASML